MRRGCHSRFRELSFRLSSSFHHSWKIDSVELARYARESGTLEDEHDITRNPPLVDAAALGSLNVLKYLLENEKVSPQNLRLAMKSAIIYGQNKMIEELLKKGADPPEALALGFEKGSDKSIAFLIKTIQPDIKDLLSIVDKAGDEGWKKLLVYAFNAHKSILVKKALKYGQNLKSPTFCNHVVSLGLENEDLEIVKEAIQLGSGDPKTVRKDGITPLHLAIHNRDYSFVNDLLTFRKVDVNTQDGNGNTALFFAVQKLDENMISLLLFHQPDVNIKNNDDVSPLEYISIYTIGIF